MEYIALDDKNQLYRLECQDQMQGPNIWHIYMKRSKETVAYRRLMLPFSEELEARDLQGRKIKVNTNPDAKGKSTGTTETGTIARVWLVSENAFEPVF